MIPELKKFIEENIDLISDNEFNAVYNKIKSRTFIRLFTEAMLEAEINPLNYMKEVPPYYLYESNIQMIDIPTGVEEINKYAFSRCSQLKSVHLPEGLNFIGEGAFYNSSLESLHLPSTVKIIYEGAFENCNALKHVTFAGTTKQWIAVKDFDKSLLRLEPVKCSDN